MSHAAISLLSMSTKTSYPFQIKFWEIFCFVQLTSDIFIRRDVIRKFLESFRFSNIDAVLVRVIDMVFFSRVTFLSIFSFLKRYRPCSKFICHIWRRWAEQARSKDFGGRGDKIRKVEGKPWIRVEQLKRNELLPCRQRSVTDSSVFISFWHDSLVSSSLYCLLWFLLALYSYFAFWEQLRARSGKRARKEWQRIVRVKNETCSVVCDWFQDWLLINILRYISL